jgi:pimeloyl-ACP methyl ester carboxylesterase
MKPSDLQTLPVSRTGLAAGVALAAAAATAAWVEVQARRAEREHPPAGHVIDIDSVHLHYVERGEGPPVVLLHGNMVSLDDFEASGLIDRLAQSHRVIAFDRPGFGHSTRPRDRLWTPAAQAALLHTALQHLGIERPFVVGHSMGTLVALALALDHPDDVSGLALLGGYYYPSVRLDALLTAPVALPLVGDVMRYTVTAISARLLIERSVEAMFWPNEVPEAFFPALSREMMLRPVQLRANAEDAAFMIPAAAANQARYPSLRMPMTIIAGDKDKVVDPQDHSVRLHKDVPHSDLVLMPDVGHMVHHVKLETVAVAVERAGAKARSQDR